MEQIANLLPSLESTKEQGSSLTQVKPPILSAMTADENQVVAVKYSEPQIAKLDTETILKQGTTLLIKIHAITGWILPQDEILAVFLEQFTLKLSESYPNCNMKEIEYAFRTHGTTVKDWGKQMNLSLIDEVMNVYLERRALISRMEESQRNKPLPPPKFDDEAYSDALRGNAEMWYQWMLLGKLKHVPDEMKEILVKDEFLKEEENIVEWIVKEIGSGRKHIYTK